MLLLFFSAFRVVHVIVDIRLEVDFLQASTS